MFCLKCWVDECKLSKMNDGKCPLCHCGDYLEKDAVLSYVEARKDEIYGEIRTLEKEYAKLSRAEIRIDD